MNDLLDGTTPYSLYTRLQQGILYRLTTKINTTKIALRHHLNDFIKTLLLNLFFANTLKTIPARLISNNKKHVIIHPLIYITETETRNYTKKETLPIIECYCPTYDNLNLQQQHMKHLIAQLKIKHPNTRTNTKRYHPKTKSPQKNSA